MSLPYFSYSDKYEHKCFQALCKLSTQERPLVVTKLWEKISDVVVNVEEHLEGLK